MGLDSKIQISLIAIHYLTILMSNNFFSERQVCREKVGDLLTEKILYIAEVMNRHEYVPKMPNQSELDLIFDTNFPDVQPYLFKVSSLLASLVVLPTTAVMIDHF